MSDAADDSDDNIAAMTDIGLAQVRKRMAVRDLQPAGACHSPLCGESIDGNRLFCNRDCSEDWDKAQAAKRRGGR